MDINGGTPKRMVYNGKSDQHGNWEVMNGNFRILKWRYCTIFQAIFCTNQYFYEVLIVNVHNRGCTMFKSTIHCGDAKKRWSRHRCPLMVLTVVAMVLVFCQNGGRLVEPK